MKSWTTSHRSTAVADFCEHSVHRMWKKSTLILVGLSGEGGNSVDHRGQSECRNINSWCPQKEIVIATGSSGQRVVEGGVTAASALDKLSSTASTVQSAPCSTKSIVRREYWKHKTSRLLILHWAYILPPAIVQCHKSQYNIDIEPVTLQRHCWRN